MSTWNSIEFKLDFIHTKQFDMKSLDDGREGLKGRRYIYMKSVMDSFNKFRPQISQLLSEWFKKLESLLGNGLAYYAYVTQHLKGQTRI